MSFQFTSGRFKGWASDGTPLASGRLYTYASGTTTQKNAFTDSGLGTPCTYTSDGVGGLYIALDARGEAQLWLGTGAYTFVLKTSTGASVWTVDGVQDPKGEVDTLRADLLNNSDDAKGSALIGYDGRTLKATMDELHLATSFAGVDNTGATDTTTALNAAIASVGSGTLVLIGTFKISGSGLAVTCNTFMYPGSKLTTSSMSTDAAVFDVTARSRHEGVRVEGNSGADPANGTIGIRVSGLNASRSTFVNCSGINCKYGGVVRTFSVTLDDCRFNSNTCNLSMSAASSSVQINDVKVRGGNYANPLGTYAVKIGDPDATTTVAAGQPHGQGISLNGFAVDGGTIKVDSALCVSIGTAEPIYHENPTSGIGLELGTAGQDDYVGGVEVGPCFYNTMKYAVFCNAGIKSLDVHPSTYTSVTKCALYVMTDIYPFTYRSGKSVSSFTLAPEVHTGRRHATFTTHDFTYVTMPTQGVIAGIQTVLNEPDWQFAQAEWKEGQTLKRSSPTEYGYGRRYKTPTTGKAGSLNSYLFTFTTTSDAKFYNGGDEYDAGGLGGGVIDRVDYETGIAYLSDSSVGVPTGGTLSQNTSAWISETRTTTGSAPASGTWAKGDKCDNANPAVGNPKGWICTVAGTPGTWVSTGNL